MNLIVLTGHFAFPVDFFENSTFLNDDLMEMICFRSILFYQLNLGIIRTLCYVVVNFLNSVHCKHKYMFTFFTFILLFHSVTMYNTSSVIIYSH